MVFTYHTTNATMSCRVWVCLIALSSILESVIPEARVEVRAVASLETGD